jgi:hypothetical protein
MVDRRTYFKWTKVFISVIEIYFEEKYISHAIEIATGTWYMQAGMQLINVLEGGEA